MENQDSIYLFLDIIGGMLGPVIGVMMAHYFVVMRGQINLDELYTAPGDYKYYDNGFNLTAFSVTLVAVILSLGGKFIPLWNRYHVFHGLSASSSPLRPTPY